MIPRTVAHQAPLSMGFPRQEYWSGLLFSSPGDLPNPRIEPASPGWQSDSLPLSYLWSHGMWWADLKYPFQFYDSVISLITFYLCCRSGLSSLSFFLRSMLEVGPPVFLRATCRIGKQESTQDKANVYQSFSQKANARSCFWSTQYLAVLPQLPVFKTVTGVKNHDLEAL